MNYLKSFISGYAATLLFHQGLWAALYSAGKVPNAAWDFSATEPFAIPAVLSLAFWGGIWGIALWPLIRRGQFWIKSIVLGAIGPSSVALFVVFPLKGLPLAGGWEPAIIAGALMLNAAWGLGLGLGLKLMRAK